jgi:hypothetical protein
MKKIILLLSLLVVAMFLVSCTPAEEVSDEELEAELEQLSDEELDMVIEEGEAEKDGALVGEARRLTIGKMAYDSEKALKSAYKVKLNKMVDAKSIENIFLSANKLQIEPTPKYPCNESDWDKAQKNGKNWYEKAKTQGSPQYGSNEVVEREDFCLINENDVPIFVEDCSLPTTCYLVEHFCLKQNNDHVVSSELHICTDGCADGACK